MSKRSLVLLLGVFTGLGAALHGGRPSAETPPLSQAAQRGLSYHLANRALLAGEFDQAMTYLGEAAAGGDPRTLCQGVVLDLKLQQGSFPFCHPEKAPLPAELSQWRDAQVALAREQARERPAEAVDRLERVLVVLPYDLTSHELLAEWLPGADRPEDAETHAVRAQELSHPRVDALHLEQRSRL